MTRPLYTPGDRHRAATEHVRVHRPICLVKRGACGCSEGLHPQPTVYYINDVVVPREEYEAAQAEYRRLRAIADAAFAEVERVMTESGPRYVGPSDNLAAGTVLDLMVNSNYYADVAPELQQAIVAFLIAFRQAP